MAMVWKSLAVYFAALVPLTECKGAVVLARMLGLSHLMTGVLSMAGSYTPVLFLLYTERGRQIHMKKQRKSLPESFQKYLSRYGCWALLVLIAIPFTGMGCWLGAILARAMKLNKVKAAICIFIGNLIAVIVMTGAVHGIVTGVQALLG